jgi:hypothetical protein
MRRLSNVDYFSAILLAVDRWEEMDQTAATAVTVLRRRHHSPGRQPDDFQLMNQKQLLDTQIAASEQLMFFVRWIGISTLAVSGLAGDLLNRDLTGDLGPSSSIYITHSKEVASDKATEWLRK